jgi:hypothetical protein
MRSLCIRGHAYLGEEALLAKQLRTNPTLLHFRLCGPSTPSRELMDGIEGALSAYNFSLRTFRAVGWERHRSIPRNLRRNKRIRKALELLPTYRVAPPARWPLVLEILYRFLRRGDFNDLVEHLLQVES